MLENQLLRSFYELVALFLQLVTYVTPIHYLLNHSLTEGFELLYWRHRNDEVDFVMKKGNKVIGLEVKSGATQRLSGMKAFKEQHKPDKVFLIGSQGLTWQEFLGMSPIELF